MMAPSSGGECACFLQRTENVCWEEAEDEQEARKVKRMKRCTCEHESVIILYWKELNWKELSLASCFQAA
jgi:hypothetical protein